MLLFRKCRGWVEKLSDNNSNYYLCIDHLYSTISPSYLVSNNIAGIFFINLYHQIRDAWLNNIVSGVLQYPTFAI